MRVGVHGLHVVGSDVGLDRNPAPRSSFIIMSTHLEGVIIQFHELRGSQIKSLVNGVRTIYCHKFDGSDVAGEVAVVLVLARFLHQTARC